MDGSLPIPSGAVIGLRADSCLTCPFKQPAAQGGLECHRFPPIAHPVMAMTPQGPQVAGVVAAWPAVQPDQWCGEHPTVAAKIARGLVPGAIANA